MACQAYVPTPIVGLHVQSRSSASAPYRLNFTGVATSCSLTLVRIQSRCQRMTVQHKYSLI